MTDPDAIRWESIGVIAGVLVLAVWALRDPVSSSTTSGDPAGMVARFRIYVRARAPRVADVEDGAVMGRSADCAVWVDDPTVSKHHARLALAERVRLEDLGSTNGTYVNGRRVDGSAALKKGDRIALGAAKIVFLGLAPRGQLRPKG